MSKHTPGPWTFGHWGDDFWVSPDSSGLTQKVARVTWGMGEEREEGRENARLIAAAPDLLEALKLHDEWCRRERQGPVYPEGINRDTPGNEAIWREWFYGNVDLCRRAEEATVAAIAKAEATE